MSRTAIYHNALLKLLAHDDVRQHAVEDLTHAEQAELVAMLNLPAPQSNGWKNMGSAAPRRSADIRDTWATMGLPEPTYLVMGIGGAR